MLEIKNFNKIIVANWKMNGSLDLIEEYLKNLNLTKVSKDVCGVICPPSIYLQSFYLTNKSLYIGAQDCSNYEKGPYTGETSALMLKDNDCTFCIVGHSERRAIFKENDKVVRLKSSILIDNGIIPIICIGETLDQKRLGLTKEVLLNQILSSIPKNASTSSIIIAYEPVWAIGSDSTPSLEEIEEIHYFLKHEITNFNNYKIIYGGSVKSINSSDIMNLKFVDGVLVGGASLDCEEFSKILKN